MSRYLSGSSSHSSSSLLNSSSLWSSVLWLVFCNCKSVFPDSAAKEEQAEYCIEEPARTLIISLSSMLSVLLFFGNSATEIVQLYSAIYTCFDSNKIKLNNTGIFSCSYFWSVGADRRTDESIVFLKKIYFHHMKESPHLRAEFCWVIDHRWGQSAVTTSATLDRRATFLLLPHFDLICNLLLNRLVAIWNLFIKVTFS